MVWVIAMDQNKNNQLHLLHGSVSTEQQSKCSEGLLLEITDSGCRTMKYSQGRLQCSRLHKYVGRLLHVKFKSTKSWLKAATTQLCIHKINQQQLSSLDLGPTALTHPGSSLLIWKGLGSTLQETTKLYSSSGLCDSACEIARKS